MTAPLHPRTASKSDLIETILRHHGTLSTKRIAQELRLVGMDAEPKNVGSLLAGAFKRFVSLKPGLWQLQDPALSHIERLAAYERSRGREFHPGLIAALESLDKPPPTPAPPPKAREPRVPAAAALPAPPLPPKPLLATAPAPKPPPRPPKARKTECPRCLKRDVVRDSTIDWSICLACGHVL